MDHVKDELQSYIKRNLKYQKKKSDGHAKSMINDLTLMPFAEKAKDYNEIIDKIIDFYELFKCSIENIVDVWKEKLGHIDKLYEVKINDSPNTRLKTDFYAIELIFQN